MGSKVEEVPVAAFLLKLIECNVSCLPFNLDFAFLIGFYDNISETMVFKEPNDIVIYIAYII